MNSVEDDDHESGMDTIKPDARRSYAPRYGILGRGIGRR